MKLSITLDTPHNANREAASAWEASLKLCETVLTAVQVHGPFTLKPIRQGRWSQTKQPDLPMKVGPIDGQSIKIRTKPGDNGSVWDYALTPRNGQSLEHLHLALFKYVHRRDDANPPDTAALPPSEIATTPGPFETMIARIRGMEDVIQRDQQRKAKMQQLCETIAVVQQEIKDREAELKTFEDEQLQLLAAEESDTEAAAARQLLDLLNNLLPPGKN